MDFAKDEDYYNSHLGVTSTDLSLDDYCQDGLGYEYCYSGVVDNSPLTR